MLLLLKKHNVYTTDLENAIKDLGYEHQDEGGTGSPEIDLATLVQIMDAGRSLGDAVKYLTHSDIDEDLRLQVEEDLLSAKEAALKERVAALAFERTSIAEERNRVESLRAA